MAHEEAIIQIYVRGHVLGGSRKQSKGLAGNLLKQAGAAPVGRGLTEAQEVASEVQAIRKRSRVRPTRLRPVSPGSFRQMTLGKSKEHPVIRSLDEANRTTSAVATTIVMNQPLKTIKQYDYGLRGDSVEKEGRLVRGISASARLLRKNKALYSRQGPIRNEASSLN
ncbi:hypothetical protein K474DRAFT_1678895 [Panus rudis PR-1116 ss-1]|nr:hypothetical protein K474DRAFT_1678895 [Panus rudis PR-1116 ss-1]